MSANAKGSSSGRKTALIVGILAFLTGAHWFVQERMAGGRALYVSTVDPGERIAGLASLEVLDFASGDVATLLGDGACELVVFYASTCPFCHEAALKEARRESGPTVPTIWVTDTDDDAAKKFMDFVHEDSRVAFRKGIKKTLGIQAVPAAILVRNGEEVLDTWPYRGNESPERFEALCEGRSEV